MTQDVIDEAVKIATRMALNGHPVERIVWIPPATASEDPRGRFAVQECRPLAATEIPPWEL